MLGRLRRLVSRDGGPPPVTPRALSAEFTVYLDRSQREVPVAQDVSVLEALEAAGVEAPNSCRNGICGSCETRIISGTPVHRDWYLDDEQRRSGNVMTICVSRAEPGSRLVLDL